MDRVNPPVSARRSVYYLPAMLAIDAIILILFLSWAFVTHYKMVRSPLYGSLLFSKVDFSLMEMWGYIKEILIIAIAARYAMRSSNSFSLAYAVLFIAVLLDDSLQLHERLGGWLAHSAGLGSLGFLMAPILISGTPFALVLLAYWMLPGRERSRFTPPLLLFFMLSFLAVVMDHMVDALVGTHRMQTLFALIEDGGEMVCLTMIVGIWLRLLAQPAPLSDDASLLGVGSTATIP